MLDISKASDCSKQHQQHRDKREHPVPHANVEQLFVDCKKYSLVRVFLHGAGFHGSGDFFFEKQVTEKWRKRHGREPTQEQ